MKCPNCGTERKIHKVDKFTKIHYCPNYCRGSIKLDVCNHESKHMARVGKSIRYQCSDGGEYVGQFVSTKGYDIDNLPDGRVMNDAYKSRNERTTPKVRNIFKRYNDKSETDWWDKYDAYLSSEKWKSKRDKVLKRDNYLCQACLENKATEVHHKTYRYVGDEPLFDLVSVCNPCHERITNIDRRNNDYS